MGLRAGFGEEPAQTAAGLRQRSVAANVWKNATVNTQNARLVQKGAVTGGAGGSRYLYRPEIARADAVGAESRRFGVRLFGGRVGPMIAHLAEREALSDADIEEIEALLRKLKS